MCRPPGKLLEALFWCPVLSLEASGGSLEVSQGARATLGSLLCAHDYAERDSRASQNKGRSTVTQGCKFDWDPLGRWALARNNRLDELNTFIGSQHFSRGFSCPRVLRTVMKSVSA